MVVRTHGLEGTGQDLRTQLTTFNSAANQIQIPERTTSLAFILHPQTTIIVGLPNIRDMNFRPVPK